VKTIFNLIRRTQLTRGRAFALGGLGLLPIILAVAIRAQSATDIEAVRNTFDVIDGLGLAVLAPVTSLVLASAALGDLAEDRTLVYVWLRPLARWKLALGALGATLAVSLPFVLVPLTAAVVIGTGRASGELLAATVVGTVVAVVGYGTLFLGLGLRVRRALVWGLGYVVIWEGAVARTARGAARISVQVYARSLLAAIADHSPPRQAASVGAAIIVPIIVVTIAYAVTVRWLERAEVA
jgi:ABC-2 type transport system permease protein